MKTDYTFRLDQIEKKHEFLLGETRGLSDKIRRLREDLEVASILGEDEPARPQVVKAMPEPVIEPPELPKYSTPTPQKSVAKATEPAPQKPKVVEPAKSGAPQAENFELRFGKIWLVRIGILVFLTGIVFLANYAYKEFVLGMGPMAKSMGLLLGGGLMSVAGWWAETRRKDLVKFGQVLNAGGLATVFYTLYASHYVEPLKWIGSAALTGALLFAWTGVMGWIADRRKSQVLAGFSLLLAYYTCVVTPVGGFTLFATLLLSVCAVFFLLKNRWVALSTAALPATYGAYGFWQFVGSEGGGVTSLGLGSLLAFWAVFTAAVFLSRAGQLSDRMRSAVATLNNIAVFALGAATMVTAGVEGIWLWSASLGSIFLGLAYFGKHWFESDSQVSKAYLAGGILLLTLGVVMKFSGYQLPLILTAESVALALASTFHWRKWYRSASMGAAVLALVTGIDAMRLGGAGVLFSSLVMIGVFAGLGYWLNRQNHDVWDRCSAVGLAVLAQLLLVFTIENFVSSPFEPLVALGSAVVLVATLRWHRFGGLALGSWIAVGYAGLIWLGECSGLLFTPMGPDWFQFSMLAGTVMLGWLWLKQTEITLEPATSDMIQWVVAIAEVMILFCWLNHHIAFEAWAWVGIGLALLLWLKGKLLGTEWSALIGQAFYLLAICGFYEDLMDANNHLWYGPIVILGSAVLYGIACLGQKAGESKALNYAGVAIRKVAPLAVTFVSILWIFEFVPNVHYAWIFALISGGVGVVGGLLQRKLMLWNSAVFFALAMGCFALSGKHFTWIDGFSIALLLGVQQIWRRVGKDGLLPRWSHGLAISAIVGAAWWFVSDHMVDQGYWTVGWSVLGITVFGLGLLLSERTYRWCGLLLIGITVGKLVFVDLWAYGTLTRVFSFLAMGGVLVLIGFLYNRFSEVLKKCL